MDRPVRHGILCGLVGCSGETDRTSSDDEDGEDRDALADGSVPEVLVPEVFGLAEAELPLRLTIRRGDPWLEGEIDKACRKTPSPVLWSSAQEVSAFIQLVTDDHLTFNGCEPLPVTRNRCTTTRV